MVMGFGSWDEKYYDWEEEYDWNKEEYCSRPRRSSKPKTQPATKGGHMTNGMFIAMSSYVFNALSETGVRYFLGGSHRFGYNTNKSDIDLFLYHPTPVLLLKELFPGDVELTPVNNSNYSITKGKHFRGFNGLVDFIFLPSLDDWLALSEEHDKVWDFLYKNPGLAPFIREISPLCNLKGKDFYRALVKVMEAK